MRNIGMDPIEIELIGRIPSKKNKYSTRIGRKGIFKDCKLRAELDSLLIQIPAYLRGLNLEHPDIEVSVYVSNLKQDRDNMLTTILDILVESGVLADDSVAHCNGRITLLPAVKSEAPGALIRIWVKDKQVA